MKVGLVLIILALALTSCQSAKLIDSDSKFSQFNQKVLLERSKHSKNRIEAHRFSGGSLSMAKEAERHVIDASKTYSLLIDESCVYDNGENQTLDLPWAHDPIKVRYRPELSNYSRLQSHKVSLVEAMSVYQLERSLQNEACIVGLSHNRELSIRPQSDLDPDLFKQKHHLQLQSQVKSQVFFSDLGENAPVIAIIDTGVDLNHNDLKENLWINSIEAMGTPGVDDDQNGYIDDIHGFNFAQDIGNPSHATVNDHGTHVAGLAAAVFANSFGGHGSAGRPSKIMALNVFGDEWGTDATLIDRAVRYAADHGADVINISVGGPGLGDTTADAISYAISMGSVVVTSAGNEGIDITEEFYYPSSYSIEIEGLIPVAAIDALSGELCGNSNFSKKYVFVAAPGCDQSAPKKGLFSTRSRNRYGYKKGTSMAAPLVSGAIASAKKWLESQRGDKVTPKEINQWLNVGIPDSNHLEGKVRGAKILKLDQLSKFLLQR